MIKIIFICFYLIFLSISDVFASTYKYYYGSCIECNAEYISSHGAYISRHVAIDDPKACSHSITATSSTSYSYRIGRKYGTDCSPGSTFHITLKTKTCVDPAVFSPSLGICVDPEPEEQNPCQSFSGKTIFLVWSGSMSKSPVSHAGCAISGVGVGLCVGSATLNDGSHNCASDFIFSGAQRDAVAGDAMSSLPADDGSRGTTSVTEPDNTTIEDLPPNSICDNAGNCTTIDTISTNTDFGDVSSKTKTDTGVNYSNNTGGSVSSQTTTTTTTYIDGSSSVTTITSTTTTTSSSNTVGSNYGDGVSTRSSTPSTSSTSNSTRTQTYDSNGQPVSDTGEQVDAEEPPCDPSFQICSPVSGPGAAESWYTSSYPNGVSDLYTDFILGVQNGPIGDWLHSWNLPNSGAFPSYTFNANISGIGNFGTYTLSLSNNVVSAIRAILLISASFFAFRLVFGGA